MSQFPFREDFSFSMALQINKTVLQAFVRRQHKYTKDKIKEFICNKYHKFQNSSSLGVYKEGTEAGLAAEHVSSQTSYRLLQQALLSATDGPPQLV